MVEIPLPVLVVLLLAAGPALAWALYSIVSTALDDKLDERGLGRRKRP